MAKVIIASHGGGLGDNLIYSSLPERFVRERGDEVWICNRPRKRNDETYDLIWGKNPFVAGFTDEPANAGVGVIARDFIYRAKHLGTPVLAVEELHGFKPLNRYPRIYHQPTYRPEYRETVFADPRSISMPTNAHHFNVFALEISRWWGYDFPAIVRMDSPHGGPHGASALNDNPRLPVRDIYEYVDLIWSCKAFLVAESGGQVLAAAIKGGAPFPRMVHALFGAWARNDKIFTFDNVDYSTTTVNAVGSGDWQPYPFPPQPLDHFGGYII